MTESSIKTAAPDFEQQLLDMNEALLLSSLRQHSLTEEAEKATNKAERATEAAEHALEKVKRAEVALHASEERFRAIAENIPQLAWMAAGDGRVSWFNHGWLEYTGTTLEENLGDGWKAVHHPDHVDAVAEKFERHLREGKDWEDTFPLRGRDDTYRWFLSRMTAIHDEAGKVERFFGTSTDITEQRRIEDALRDNQTHLAESQMRLAMELSATTKLQEVSTELIGEGDPKALYGKIVSAAAAIMRAQKASLHIYHPEVGSNGVFRLLAHQGFTSPAAEYWDLVSPSSKSISGAVLDTAGNVSVPNVEASDLLAGTRDLSILIENGIHSAQATPLISRSGKILGMISTYWRQPHQPVERDLRLLDVLARQAADLIERSQAEEQLSARERHLTLITASVPVSIIHLDADRKVRFANQEFLNRLGKRSEDVLGKSMPEILGEENFEKVEPHLAQAFQGEPQNYEVRINYPTIGKRDLFVHDAPLKNAFGQVQGLVSVIEDITERNHSRILLDTQKEALEMIVGGGALVDVLEYLTRVVEGRSTKGSIASILLVEDGRLRNGASPSLPLDYLQAIDGLQVHESIGTCSAAAATCKTVITPDIAADPKWQEFKHLPLGLGLQAAWSQPIIEQDGRILGTFGTYFREKREPTELERKMVEILAKTAAIAIERNRTEQKLRESEEQYRTLFNSIDEGFYILEKVEAKSGELLDFRYVEANPAFAIQSGLSDVIGKTVRQVVPGEPEEWYLTYDAVLNTGEPIRFERELVTKGSVLELYAFRVGDETHRGVAVIFRNITERIRIDEKLKQSEEWLRTIFDASHEGILIEDEERINYINRSYLDLFGYDDPKELIGEHVSVVVSDEDSERVLEFGRGRLRGEQPPSTYEFRGKRKDGTLLDVEASVSTATVADRTYITTMIRDIGRRKRAEEALLRTREDLELRVEIRTRELAKANETLKTENQERLQAEAERFKLLTQIVTTQEDERRRIARDIHDHLGQGLTALRLRIASLQEAYEADSELGDRVAVLQELAVRLDAAVGFLAYELRPTVLDDLGLGSAIEEFAKEWTRHHGIPSEVHSGRFKMERLDPEVETNLYRIAQEALNNIYKHAKAKNVNLVLERRKDEVVMIVEDDGIGFEPGAKRDVSDPGRALGLIGIRERAALVGGTVEFESSPGKGTTIFVRVPFKSGNGR